MSATRRVPQAYTDATVALEPGGPLGRGRLVVRKRMTEVIIVEAAAGDSACPQKHTGHRLVLPREGLDLADAVTGVNVSADRLRIGLTREATLVLGLPGRDPRLVCHVKEIDGGPESIRNGAGLLLGGVLGLHDAGLPRQDTEFGVYRHEYLP